MGARKLMPPPALIRANFDYDPMMGMLLSRSTGRPIDSIAASDIKRPRYRVFFNASRGNDGSYMTYFTGTTIAAMLHFEMEPFEFINTYAIDGNEMNLTPENIFAVTQTTNPDRVRMYAHRIYTDVFGASEKAMLARNASYVDRHRIEMLGDTCKVSFGDGEGPGYYNAFGNWFTEKSGPHHHRTVKALPKRIKSSHRLPTKTEIDRVWDYNPNTGEFLHAGTTRLASQNQSARDAQPYLRTTKFPPGVAVTIRVGIAALITQINMPVNAIAVFYQDGNTNNNRADNLVGVIDQPDYRVMFVFKEMSLRSADLIREMTFEGGQRVPSLNGWMRVVVAAGRVGNIKWEMKKWTV